MEEKQERRSVGDVELEGGQSSRNSGETGPEPKEHRIDVVETNPTVKNWDRFVQKAKERIQSQSQWPRIPKVPQMLRGTRDFKKLYEPRVISLGPYHHGKRHLRLGEMIKPVCTQKFLDDSNQDIKALYTKIESNIEAVRKCYNKRSTNKYDNEALAWMMLLDGCFLLQFIRSQQDNSKVVLSNVLRDHQIYFLELDLFLLENQLPFGVLKLIFEEAKFKDSSIMQEMIKNFLTPENRRPDGSTSKPELEEKDEEPSHLLDLLRSALLGRYKRSSKKKVGSQTEPKQQDVKKTRLPQGGDGGSCCLWKKSKQKGNWQSFRNIKELKAAGIHLQPSRTRFLTDISFNSYFFYGYLNLPPLIIDDLTKAKFLNIVAYEMCPDAPDDYVVTSYIYFLYELIDHADDVKELRSKHILYNCLGSDEDVAQIFNEIGNDVVFTELYEDVKDRIQKHYDKRVNAWITQALHDHFSTPWTFMAFIGAVSILVLTGIQTYFAPGK
ncbi:hypothetical protein PVL29_018022 [Vitis rotundifolia]|uniref:Uncharacterized protein n=1 Tax=Vitis rotundifolia TaxID=103349 RepID=A0AA38Z3W4_VITRO|nr:hypothetical protein PVL29_018022 [Vitis rotundifolia]